jgi:hypothetical protein
MEKTTEHNSKITNTDSKKKTTNTKPSCPANKTSKSLMEAQNGKNK